MEGMKQSVRSRAVGSLTERWQINQASVLLTTQETNMVNKYFDDLRLICLINMVLTGVARRFATSGTVPHGRKLF
jgi:hypothetical protein